MAYDSNRGRVVLFGGSTIASPGSNITLLADTWEWDGATWTVRTTTNLNVVGPTPRVQPGMAYDSGRGKIVLFGGFGCSTISICLSSAPSYSHLGDTWEWDGTSWTQISSTGPSPRSGHGMAYDSASGHVLLFGGLGDGGACPAWLDDSWEWDGTKWTQMIVTGPPARAGHVMAGDSVRKRIVLFGGGVGGGTNSASLSDTWEWDGTSWSQRASSGPSGSYYVTTMAYDSSTHHTLLFGGGSFVNPLAETWEWDGSGWSKLSIAGPPGRTESAMAYDGAHNAAVLFGGVQPPNADYDHLLADTWMLQGPAPDSGGCSIAAGGRKRADIATLVLLASLVFVSRRKKKSMSYGARGNCRSSQPGSEAEPSAEPSR